MRKFINEPVIAYIVDHAYPNLNDGYAVRTHEVAKATVESGIRVIVFVVGKPGTNLKLRIDGVVYLHITAQQEQQLAFLSEAISVFKVTHIVGASNWKTAQIASDVARENQLPFAYEVRGFWELTRVASEPQWEATSTFLFHQAQERQLYETADRIFTLTVQMADYIKASISRPTTIDIVPNGLSDAKPSLAINENTPTNKAHITLGYIGSFSELEGLELLIKLVAELQVTEWKNQISLLLVGASGKTVDGQCTVTASLKDLAEKLGVTKFVSFAGRVSRSEVNVFYQQIDIFIIPRRDLKVCQLVSPIKPLEAAYYSKTIVVSDVAPLKDMAKEASFGIFEADNLNSLKQVMLELMSNEVKRNRMAKDAKRWANEMRDLKKLVLPVVNWVRES